MFHIELGYLAEEDELSVVQATTAAEGATPVPVLDAERLVAYQRLVRRVPIADDVARHALAIVRRSRPGTEQAPDFVDRWLSYGGSVRAAQYLVLAGKARALMRGRAHVGFEDVRAVAPPVLRHRLLRNFHAEAERVGVEQIVGELLDAVPVPGRH
jgi:MoxR-like ATPase